MLPHRGQHMVCSDMESFHSLFAGSTWLPRNQLMDRRGPICLVPHRRTHSCNLSGQISFQPLDSRDIPEE